MTSFSHRQVRAAFTLLELLVVITIIGILAAISLPLFARIMIQGRETKTMSNLRQIGAAALLYANENNQQLPDRVADGSSGPSSGNKWPTVLKPYLQDTRIYGSPIPDLNGVAYRVTDPTLYFDNTKNYTSYIYNGLNDMSPPGYATGTSVITTRLNLMDQPSQTILFGIPTPVSTQFYMDFIDKDNNTVLNRAAFPNGCPYVFADGSVRVLLYDSTVVQTVQPKNSGTYSDWYWLLNKTQTSVIQ